MSNPTNQPIRRIIFQTLLTRGFHIQKWLVLPSIQAAGVAFGPF